MTTLQERVLNVVRSTPGLTDREITDCLLGAGSKQQSVNQAVRELAAKGLITRRHRHDDKLGSYPADASHESSPARRNPTSVESAISLEEDEVKRKLKAWLEKDGWKVTVKWGHGQGIDIEARRGDRRWVIETKGCGSRESMRFNYFISVLGELLQRMHDPDAKYSIALPDLKQFQGLWHRLPILAKKRTGISALFVAESGQIQEVAGQ